MGYVIAIALIIYFIFYHKYDNGKKIESKPKFELTEEFKYALHVLNNTNESIFITGKAGTGKSSLLKYFKKNTNKKLAILAPTGIAALNVSGQTIHSFFRFPPRLIDPSSIKPDYVRAEIFKKLEILVIDEVSMVRVDLMHGIDIALRKNRNRLDEPFGGVQMVFIGDLFQLPPVLTEEYRKPILSKYKSEYFFDAPVFSDFTYCFVELTKVFRQSEEEFRFKELLNNLRTNQATYHDMVLLNSRHKSNAGEHKESIFLTTKRRIARNINTEKLNLINSEELVYTGELRGKYVRLKDESEEKLENKLPAPYKLKLKKGAQIMMLSNDSGKRWVNGTLGKISKLEQDNIIVNIEGNKYSVDKVTWDEVEFRYNKEKDELEEVVVAGFTQYPIRLAYAITIHKSQGKTFNKITVDVGTGAFAHGQVYVAISRCKTLEGIVLNNPIRDIDIIVDQRVLDYYSKVKSVLNS